LNTQQTAERAAEQDEAAANNLKAGLAAEAALPPTLLEWIGSFIVSGLKFFIHTPPICEGGSLPSPRPEPERCGGEREGGGRGKSESENGVDGCYVNFHFIFYSGTRRAWPRRRGRSNHPRSRSRALTSSDFFGITAFLASRSRSFTILQTACVHRLSVPYPIPMTRAPPFSLDMCSSAFSFNLPPSTEPPRYLSSFLVLSYEPIPRYDYHISTTTTYDLPYLPCL
jgi:hypothetical protein